jgi:hypothetical protein
MDILPESLFLFVLAVLFGVFEIEAEGKYGWGEKFPTWYRTSGWARVYTTFTNKPLTGYHTALFFVPVLIFFWPMVATSTMSWHGALDALSQYFLWVIIWDFSWFVLNPYYGVKKFRRSEVWWFSNEPWFGALPSSYVNGIITSLVLAAASGGVEGGWLEAFGDRTSQLGWYLLGTFLLIVAGAPLFRKYYSAMRTHDERSKANIFH